MQRLNCFAVAAFSLSPEINVNLQAITSFPDVCSTTKGKESMISTVLTAIAAVLAGGGIGYTIKAFLDKHAASNAQNVTANAKREADSIIKEAKIKAKEEYLQKRDEFEKSTESKKEELKKLEDRLDNKEDTIEKKAELLESRTSEVDRREKEIQEREAHVKEQEEHFKEKENELKELTDKKLSELERISGLSQEDAKKELMDQLKHELEQEQGALIKQFREESNKKLTTEAQEIMINAMERYAGDCASERTTSTVPLPGDDMKGRIIGREGRNIRTIEAATGVNLLIDDTPEAVVISCFDPVRRVVARMALERLVADGRIHPTRIEEVTEKVKNEIDDEMEKAGQDAVEELGVTGVKPELIKMLGRLRYRYSYSQNILQHSMECAYFMGIIAGQLGLDEQKARRTGLLHDIGKAVDHEVEGSHATIGADVLKRYGEEEDVINAVAAHHEDAERQSLLANLVCITDKLSASRPGARSETTELFLKRVEKLEEIGSQMTGVENCYAIQAGRELRVIVEPEKVGEEKAAAIARNIAQQVQDEVRYPGQVKVTVMRETRAVEYAK